jgi:transcriptional regulator with XRE-family HTH domain
MEIRKVLSVNLIQIRHKRGWTQEQLSWKSKMSRTFIADIERQAKSPTVDSLAILAKTLRVKPEILLTPKGYETV